MDAFSDPTVDEIVIVSSSQTSKTETLLNCIGYAVDTDPGPMLYVLPDVEHSAKIFSTERLDKMIRDTPVLHEKFSPSKATSSKNAAMQKAFAGGFIAIRGSNSPAGLSSLPVRYLFLDEVSRFKASAGKEGDPVALARKRTQTFWNKKIVMASTPATEGTCRITAAFEETDKRQRFLPCPDCGGFQVLFFSAKFGDEDKAKKRMGGIKWDKGPKGEHLFETVYYECEHCGYHIHQHEIHEMDLRGEWRATAAFNGKAGFRLNEFYSPWAKWPKIVEEFIDIKHSKDIERMKTFVNTVLGEAWRDSGENVEGLDLLGRRERYNIEKVPAGVLLLTCGVDVQDNRLEYMVLGWGKGFERWVIDYGQIMGDTCKEGAGSVYDQLGQYLKTFNAKREDGPKLWIQCTAMDTGGHRTEEVYRFCKPLEHMRVYAIKGDSGSNPWFVRLSNSKTKSGGALFRVTTSIGKKELYDSLKVTEPGPMYVHFPATELMDPIFFDQLTSEERVVRYVNNHPTYVWRKKNKWARNEALDMAVYAHAARAILNPNMEQIEKNLLKQKAAAEVEKTMPAEKKPEQTKPQNIRRQSPGGWNVKPWR